MKKQPYILIGLTSVLFVAFLFRSIFKVLDLEWTSFPRYREDRKSPISSFDV